MTFSLSVDICPGPSKSGNSGFKHSSLCKSPALRHHRHLIETDPKCARAETLRGDRNEFPRCYIIDPILLPTGVNTNSSDILS
jgi:hypothetical protein